MHKPILLTVILLLPLLGFGQGRIFDLKFTEGKLQLDSSELPSSLQAGDILHVSYRDAAATKFNDKDRDKIREALRDKIERTIRNLEDPSLNLERLYKYLWPQALPEHAPGRYHQLLLAEMKRLLSELGNKDFPDFATPDFTYFPAKSYVYSLFHPNEFTPYILQNPGPIYSDDEGRSNGVQLEQRIIYHDLFKKWLIAKYNSDPGHLLIDPWTQNANYLQSWRDAFDVYQELNAMADSFKKKPGTVINYNVDNVRWGILNGKIAAFSNSLPAGHFLERLQSGRDFYFRWLWYTEGIPVMNPFYSTDASKEYPMLTERPFYLTSDTLVLRINDSANRAYTNTLLQASEIENVVKMPISAEKNVHGFFISKKVKHLDRHILLWHLDAAANYTGTDVKLAATRMAAGQELTLLVHNLPATRTLSIATDTSTISTYSDGVEDFNTGIVKTGQFIRSFTGISAGLGSILSLVQPVASKIPKTIIEKNPVMIQASGRPMATVRAQQAAGPVDEQGIMAKAWLPSRDGQYDRLLNAAGTNMAPDPAPVLITEYKFGEIYFPLTGKWREDRISVLAYYLPRAKDKNGGALVISQAMIDAFWQQYNHTEQIDYHSEAQVAAAIKDVILKFRVYYNLIVAASDWYTNELEQINEQKQILAQFLKIPVRSLPPRRLSELPVSRAPRLRTEIVRLATPEHKKTRFTLTERDSKPGGDTVVVYRNQYSTGIWRHFDVSAGIGFTTRDYDNNYIKNDASPREIENINERVHGIAGLHYYPYGIYMHESQFCIGRPDILLHRLSLFAGIDIIRPRFNYYGGLSIDPVPGIKLIGGVQLYRNTRYEVFNDQVINQRSALRCAGPFFSLHVDADVFIKIFK